MRLSVHLSDNPRLLICSQSPLQFADNPLPVAGVGPVMRHLRDAGRPELERGEVDGGPV